MASKHNGGACHKYYDDPEVLGRFDSVRSWLSKNYKQVCMLTTSILFFNLVLVCQRATNKQAALPADHLLDSVSRGATSHLMLVLLLILVGV